MGGVDLLDYLIDIYHKKIDQEMVSSLHISLQRPHHRASMAALQKRFQRNWSTCQRAGGVMRLQATNS